MEPLSTDTLLRHATWVRALARTLVMDDARADDVVQQTWLHALEHPPRHGGAPKAWLRVVLQNTAAAMRRREVTRRRHEERSTAAADQPSVADTVARASLHRTLVDAVLSLSEPSRSAVLLRYFEGLKPSEIAASQGISVHTVTTRIQRGLATLRARMDAEWDGDPHRWHAALWPLATVPAAMRSDAGASVLSSSFGASCLSALGVFWMSTKIKWSAAVVAALLVAWWAAPDGFLSAGDRTKASSSDGRPTASRGSHEGNAQAEPLVAQRTQHVGEPMVHASEPSSPGLAGTVVLRTSESLDRAASGTFDLQVVEEGGRTVIPVTVTNGQWTAAVLPTEHLEVHEFVLNGRRALPQRVEIEVGEDGTANLFARTPARRWIEVVDAVDGSPLKGVTVVQPPRGRLIPRNEQLADCVVHGASSPVELQLTALDRDGAIELNWLAHLYVRADGYAWEHVVVNFQGEDGATQVALFRSGSIDVFVDGLWRLRSEDGSEFMQQPRIRLYSTSDVTEVPVLEREAREGAMSLDHLLPGDYEVRLEWGQAFRDDRAMAARATTVVEERGRSSVRLIAQEPLVAPTRAVVRGELRLSNAARGTTTTLRLQPVAHPHLRKAVDQAVDGEAWRFDTWAGSFELHLPEWGLAWAIDVPSSGLDGVCLEVGDLTSVTLQLTDASSGEPLRLSYGPSWCVSKPVPGPLVRLAATDGVFPFVAPTGPIRIEFWGDGFERTHLEVMLDPHEQEIILPLWRVSGVELVCRRGEAVIDLPWEGGAVSWEALDGEGRATGYTARNGSQTHFMSHPGQYRLHVESVMGYESLETVVEVRRGEIVPLDVQLTPVRD